MHFGRPWVRGPIAKLRLVAHNGLGCQLKGWVAEHDMNGSRRLEEGQQGRGDDAAEGLSNDNLVRMVIAVRRGQVGPELVDERSEGVIRTTPGTPVAEQIGCNDIVTCARQGVVRNRIAWTRDLPRDASSGAIRCQEWDELIRPWIKRTCLVAFGSPQVEADMV